MKYYPSSEEVDRAAEILDMDIEIHSLPSWEFTPVTVLSLVMSDIPPAVLHSIAEVAEELKLPLTAEYGSLYIKRPKTREELIEAVKGQIRSKLRKQHEEAEKAQEPGFLDNAREIDDKD